MESSWPLPFSDMCPGCSFFENNTCCEHDFLLDLQMAVGLVQVSRSDMHTPQL